MGQGPPRWHGGGGTEEAGGAGPGEGGRLGFFTSPLITPPTLPRITPSQGYFPRAWGLQAWGGWVRMASGRGRKKAWFGFLFKAASSPPPRQVQCGVTWGGGCAGRVFPCPSPTGEAACLHPRRLDLPRRCLPSSPFALVFPQPRGFGGAGCCGPGAGPPGSRGPDPRPLALGAGAGVDGGAGSPGGLALGVRVPSLSLAFSPSPPHLNNV